jgi:hypothetical protein
VTSRAIENYRQHYQLQISNFNPLFDASLLLGFPFLAVCRYAYADLADIINHPATHADVNAGSREDEALGTIILDEVENLLLYYHH